MNYLSVTNLTKSFGDFVAIDNIDINIARGEVCSLLGPSGCGKTTTLRCIAGLETADRGSISLEGHHLFDSESRILVAPEKRQLGMVFQSYALWPHKSVGENIALGLRIKGIPGNEIKSLVAEGLELVGMAGAEDRFPASLSGGQQQRVALARALTLKPKCILFDEPLSNLDLLLRERMRFEIRELLIKVGITAVYVTHDQTEAMVISDHVVVLNRGQIEQEGRPEDVYVNPRTRFTAEFLGRTNILPLERELSDPAEGLLAAPGGVKLYSGNSQRLGSENEKFLIAFRPEMISLQDTTSPGKNQFSVKVVSSQFLGAATQVILDFAGHQISATLPGNQMRSPGQIVNMAIDPSHVLLLRDSA